MIKPHHHACAMMILLMGCALVSAYFHNYAAIWVFMFFVCLAGWGACKLHDDYKRGLRE